MRKNQSGSAHVVVIVILVIALVGALGFIFWQNFIDNNRDSAKDSQSQNAGNDSDTDSEESTEGVIQGSLIYPSHGIPETVEVYAVNLDTDQEYVTTEHLNDDKYQYGVGYRLAVPEGRYHVYGVLKDNPDRKAYYNQFVVCGTGVECDDLSRIEVKVEPGQETKDIIVGDWWN